MTAIKPPTGPGNVSAPPTTDAASESERVGGPSFAERAERAENVSGPGGARSVSNVIADLGAGKISPQEALDQIVSITIAQSGALSAFRPAIEAQVRAMLASNPDVRAKLVAMGIPAPSEK